MKTLQIILIQMKITNLKQFKQSDNLALNLASRFLQEGVNQIEEKADVPFCVSRPNQPGAHILLRLTHSIQVDRSDQSVWQCGAA